VHSILKPAVFFLTLGIAISAFPQTKAANRITQAIDDRDTTQLRGNVHGFLQHYADQGRLDGGTKLQGVSLIFKRTAAQDAAIEKLLADQQNPASANYHKWLTPEEYADRFGLSPADASKVVSWLQSEGFTVDRVSRGRTEVFFSGSVSQIETVFRTEMHSYMVKGERHYANSVEPSVPASLTDVVAGLHHLDDFLPKSHIKMLEQKWQGHYNLGGQLVIAPADFKTIYNVPSSVTGSGQNIAIAGQSALYTTGSGTSTAYPDIDAFRSAFGLPARTSANFATPILVTPTDNPTWTWNGPPRWLLARRSPSSLQGTAEAVLSARSSTPSTIMRRRSSAAVTDCANSISPLRKSHNWSRSDNKPIRRDRP
jgi:hypothetical protein